jgi:DNA-binding MarR family transcriptional regulator
MIKKNKSVTSTELISSKQLTDHEAIFVLFHKQKQEILRLLIENEFTLYDLRKITKWNPGTIKRHLNDLMQYGFITQTRTEVNSFSMIMKYYRATAKKFEFHIVWPSV